MDKPIYKLFQLSNIFISKYDYNQIMLKQYQDQISNEAWLVNYKNPNYQVIRVCFNSNFINAEEKNRIEIYLNYFRKNSNLNDNLKFLDIHISNDVYDPDCNIYDYLILEENYSAGIDLKNIYPEIYSCIHNVADPVKEIKNLSKKMKEALKARVSKLPFLQRYPALFTYITIGICCLVYFVSSLLSIKYDDASTLLLCGADYKTLTLGCHEFYRLFTYAFVHNGFVHIFCNMVSLFSIGKYIESKHGHFKFVLILLTSILCGSLTQGILTDNELCVGMSGGIYGLFIVYIIDIVNSRIIDIRRLIPTLILNIMFNFWTTTAWMCHLGGAIGGFAMYFALSKEKNYPAYAMVLILVLCLVYKYATIDTINMFYGGTDNNYINTLEDLGFYTDTIVNKIISVYNKYGG